MWRVILRFPEFPVSARPAGEPAKNPRSPRRSRASRGRARPRWRPPPRRRGPIARSPTAGRCASRLRKARERSSERRRARASASPSSVTSLTRPMRSASSAPTARPVRISSIARPCPTMRGRRIVPRSISGTPKRRLKMPNKAERAGDPEIAPERELRAAGDRRPLDRGDHRLSEAQPRRPHRTEVAVLFEPPRLARGQRLEVGPGAESARPRRSARRRRRSRRRRSRLKAS